MSFSALSFINDRNYTLFRDGSRTSSVIRCSLGACCWMVELVLCRNALAWVICAACCWATDCPPDGVGVGDGDGVGVGVAATAW